MKNTTEMSREEVKAELAKIGSSYDDRKGVWVHADPVAGNALVRQIISLNRKVVAGQPVRPAAHGAKGEPGTIICIHCGKRGQDEGTVCDHCGEAL